MNKPNGNPTPSPKTRPSLLSILGNQGAESFLRDWDRTAPAEDRPPVPPGDYLWPAKGGELSRAKPGPPSYNPPVEAAEAPQGGRLVGHDFWLPERAGAMAKRALLKLGILAPKQLDEPLP